MERSITEIALEKYAQELKAELATQKAKYDAFCLIDSFYYTKLLKEKLDISVVKAFSDNAVEEIETALFKHNYTEQPELVKRHVEQHLQALFNYLEE